jgi:hypothetical protein
MRSFENGIIGKRIGFSLTGLTRDRHLLPDIDPVDTVRTALDLKFDKSVLLFCCPFENNGIGLPSGVETGNSGCANQQGLEAKKAK